MITHQLSMTTPFDAAFENNATDWNAAHVQAFTILGNTAGASTVSGTNIQLSAGPNATISVNGSTLVFSGGAGAAGNTGYLQDDAAVTASLGTINFSNSNGIGFGLNGQTLTASHNGLTSQSNQNVTAGNGGFAFQTLSFSNVNGMSFGTSAGSAITGSYTRPVVSNAIASVGSATNSGTNTSRFAADDHVHAGVFSMGVSGGNTAGDTRVDVGRFVLAGGANITLSQATAANALNTISIVGGAGGAGFSAGVSTGGNTSGDTGVTGTRLVFVGSNNVTLSQGTDANGGTVTISGANTHAVQTGISGIVASDTTYTSGTISFSNQNGVTIGSSVNGATQYVRLSVATSYRASNDAIGLNTAKTNVTWTVNSSGLSLDAGGYAGTGTSATNASITLNTNGLAISVAAPGAAAEANAINLLGANTAGNTTATGSTIGWSGINATLSGTNNSQVVISVPATSSLVGISGISISTNGSTISVGMKVGSYFGNMNGEWGNSTTMQMLQSTSHIQPFILEGPISFGQLRIPMSASVAPSSTGVTTGNSQFSYGLTRSHNFVVYSRGIGASSQSLQYVMSTQLTDRQSINVSAAANSTQFSYTNRASFQMSTGEVGFTFDYSSSAASLNFHTSGMTAITGLKQMEFKWASSLDPGQYWLMYGVSSSTVSQYTAQGTRLFNILSNYGVSQPNLAFGTIGDATHSSVGLLLGHGSFTTAGGGTTSSLPISAVTTTSAHNKMVFQMFHIA